MGRLTSSDVTGLNITDCTLDENFNFKTQSCVERFKELVSAFFKIFQNVLVYKHAGS